MARFSLAAVAVPLAASLACAWGCATRPPPERWLERLSQAPPPPPGSNFPGDPAELERLMRGARFEIVGSEPAGGGVMGALRVEAYYPDPGRTLAIKWKEAPRGAEGWNNTPRREIAAYRIQQWFLEPSDYVVPTTLGLCIPLSIYRELDEGATPNVPGMRCVFGTQAVWLEDVVEADGLLDEERFTREPHYARHLAHFNLLTYLIRNRDTRDNNALVSRDESNRRVYSVDNGISFGEWLFNYFRPHWDEIRVPALPARAVERLRQVGEPELAALAVLAEFRSGPDGVLREAEPSAPFDAERGARLRRDVLQLGLEPEERAGVRERLDRLLAAVDRGEIPLF